MRIITGEYKGRRLESPGSYDIRPTSDKVKEAMFSIISYDIEGAVCADLFSGTGNLGLEALSRGAGRCYFCDNSREALGIIKRNIASCKAADRSVVMAGDFRKCIEKIKEKADIVFMDPPYESGFYEEAFETIARSGLLDADGMIIAEHRKDLELPEKISGFEKIKERRYGHILLSIYSHL